MIQEKLDQRELGLIIPKVPGRVKVTIQEVGRQAGPGYSWKSFECKRCKGWWNSGSIGCDKFNFCPICGGEIEQ